MTRALAKEVGDETPLSKVIEGGSEWRGRAQQISLLKAKISELQQAQVLLLASAVMQCGARKHVLHFLLQICTEPCSRHIKQCCAKTTLTGSDRPI